MPVAFIPHGGGPWTVVDFGVPPEQIQSLSVYLRGLRTLPPNPPKALLVISAHWEERVPTVMTSEAPPLFFDYYGFPPDSYKLRWPAPGSPQVAVRVRELLTQAEIPSAEHPTRGFDHGTFIPLMLPWPEGEVPVVQLSLERGLDPARHLAIGRALQPLRDEGVLILGSGQSFHNLSTLGNPRTKPVSETFDAWLRDAVTREAGERDETLTRWTQAPHAREAHPREEHLLPLMVAAGAAGADPGRIAWNGDFMTWRLSAVHFG